MEMPRRFDPEPPRRVLVVGKPGSGRRALIETISERIGIPAIDGVSGRDGAVDAAWLDEVGRRAAEDEWAMTLGEHEAWRVAVQRADWFVWLDLPVSACVAGILRRALRRAPFGKRGASALGSWPQIRQALNSPAEIVPKIIATVERERRNRAIFILRTRREVKDFLGKLPKAIDLDERYNPKPST